MRKTENKERPVAEENCEFSSGGLRESAVSDTDSNLLCLADAAGRLCEVVVSACRNRSQFKENAEKGKRAKTDIKSVKEMCAVLKELTTIVKNLDGGTDSGVDEENILEVIFSDTAEKFAL